MLRLLLLSFCSSAAILLPAAELRIALFTPAQGDAAAFRKLVNSSVIGAPAGQLERLKAALSEAKPQPTPPVTLLTDGLKGKRVESGRSGNLNTLAFADPAKRQLQILVWNTGSTRGFAELVMADAGRFFGSKRVDLRLKLLTTDEKEKQPSTDRGDHAILDGALNFGIPLPPESAALLELARQRRARGGQQLAVGMGQKSAGSHRRRELAVLQAIGMTSRQLQGMLALEGLLYTVSSIVLAFFLLAVTAPFLGSVLNQAIWFFSYRFVLWPLVLLLPLFAALGVLIPLLSCRSARKSSVVERLRQE